MSNQADEVTREQMENRGEAPVLQMHDVVKSFGAVRALRGVSLELHAGEVLGVCGHNGAGKSTLMSVLVGSQHPDSGSVTLRGKEVEFTGVKAAQKSGIALVHQELSIVSTLTVAENLVLGNSDQNLLVQRRARRAKAREILDRVGLSHVSPDQFASELNLGEQQLVEIGRLLGRDADVLIFDEPTATLSSREIERVFETIRAVAAAGKAVIFISHRLDEVLTLCDRVLVLRDGEVVGSAPCGELDKATLVEMMLGPQGHEQPAPPHEPSHRRTVNLRGMTVPGRVHDLDLEVPAGSIVGLAGQVGAGASDLLRALGGLEPDATGEVTIDGEPVDIDNPRRAFASHVQYLTNDRKAEGLFLEHSIGINLTSTRLRRLRRGLWLSPKRIRGSAHSLAESAGVPTDRIAKTVSTLSGGNQQKVLVGRCLEEEGLQLLLLDEPTRGVDVGGRADIHRLIREIAATDTTVIFASTDLDEVMTLSDIVVTMFAGHIVAVARRNDTSAGAVLAGLTHSPSAQRGTAA